MTKLALIRTFYQKKDIAVIGISPKPQKFGNAVVKELSIKGFTLFPVHQSLKEIHSLPVFPSLQEVPEQVKRLFISAKPDKALETLKNISPERFEIVWIQQGGMNDELRGYLDQNRFNYISRECILMHAPPVNSIHKFHRFLKYLFKEKP